MLLEPPLRRAQQRFCIDRVSSLTQDLLSIVLHEEAVRLIKQNPQLAEKAKRTLAGWMNSQPTSRSMSLWRDWAAILANSSWQKVMASTARAQQLRQASPLGAVVPDEVRRGILAQFATHRKGVVLESPSFGPFDMPGDQREGLALRPDANKKVVGA